MPATPVHDIVSLYCYAIRVDGGTQSRAELHEETVVEYEQAMRDGATFPPLAVAYDGTEYWLMDGFHRLEASRRAEIDQLDCEIIQATKDDARWLSCAVNAKHGLKRTNADKRRAVVTALSHPRAKGLSDRAIAEHCGVSHNFICECRKTIPNCHPMTVEPRRGRDGKLRRQPAPKPRYPIPGDDGHYDDEAGITRRENYEGGRVCLRVLRVGDNSWKSAYSVSIDQYEYSERIQRFAGVFLSLDVAMTDAATRAATRLRLKRGTADQTPLALEQIEHFLLWLAGQGAPADRAAAAAPPRVETAETADDDVAADMPDSGGFDWPQPNHAGVYGNHPGTVLLQQIGPGGCSARLEMLRLTPNWKGPRWISAFSCELNGGRSHGEPLTTRSREFMCRELAQNDAALRLAVWLSDAEAGATKLGKRQIAALRKWAVEMGADLLEIDEARRREDEARRKRLAVCVTNIIDGLDLLRVGFEGIADFDVLADQICQGAEDPDDDTALGVVKGLDSIYEKVGRIVFAMESRATRKEAHHAA